MDNSLGLASALLALCLALSAAHVVFTLMRARRWDQCQARMRELDRLRMREMQASRMKSNFIASISHDLRTPLNSILGFSELIRDKPQDDANSRYAALIHGSGRQLHGLLEDLQQMSRIEAARMDVEVTDVDVAESVLALAARHRASAEGKGITLTVKVDAPPGHTVRADTDAGKFTKVLDDVLGNALVFTDSGSVNVTARCSGGLFIVTVSCAGRCLQHALQRDGMDPRLAAARDALLLLGGAMAVKPRAGEGSTLTITLPGARLRQKSARAHGQSADASGSRSAISEHRCAQ